MGQLENREGKNIINSELNPNDEESNYNGDDVLKEKFLQFHKVQQLQKSILRQNMHNAMSPLSAISGYLELIDMTLNMDSDISQLQYYRQKIETGVREVNDILAQLQEVYKENEAFDDESEEINVDINWVVEDLYREMKIKRRHCYFKLHPKPIHIVAHLHTIKLIIFKLINYAVKSSLADDKVLVLVNEDNDTAVISVSFTISDIKKREINQIIRSTDSLSANFDINQSSLNEGLSLSLQLIKYMKGDIFFKDEDAQRVSFILSLPKS